MNKYLILILAHCKYRYKCNKKALVVYMTFSKTTGAELRIDT